MPEPQRKLDVVSHLVEEGLAQGLSIEPEDVTPC
jgi:hypothetical protein